MKITLSVRALLDDIYADSAIAAVLRRRDPAYTAPLLTYDHRHALRRAVVHGAAFVATALVSRLKGLSLPEFDGPCDPRQGSDEIVFEVDDSTTASPEALKIHLSNAVTFACLELVAISACDNTKAEAYRQCVYRTAQTITQCLDNIPTLPSIRPSYY